MTDAQSIRPLIPNATPPQIGAILGAMRGIAGAGRGRSEADDKALASAAHYMFGADPRMAFERRDAVGPDALAAALGGSALAEDAVKLLVVMSVIDAPLDRGKLDLVLQYAQRLGVQERYLHELAEAAEQRMREALADMTRANMESILNQPWTGGDVLSWLLPYQGVAGDPGLAARFQGLWRLGGNTFGYAFWRHFTDSGYTFPGEATALNAAFSVPHDSVHVLTGYHTDGRGEILTSTFTASMHRNNPMAGHILPAIFSWHLKVQINDVAGNFEGALDPQEVWRAWAAGAQATVDTFDAGWDFWEYVGRDLEELRKGWSIPGVAWRAWRWIED